MPNFISVRVTGNVNQDQRIQKLSDGLRDLDMSFAIRRIGEIWRQNFLSEGAMVGRWAPLAPATNRVRMLRGYDPENPILQQGGALYRVAAGMPTGHHGKNSSASGDGVTGTIRSGNNKARLTISGDKVENQYGGSGPASTSGMFRAGPQSWTMPARPFWFINATVERAARRGVQEAVSELVSKT